MTAYTEKLEDTIWCNDRTLYSGSLVGKNFDSGASAYSYSYFGAYNRVYNTYKYNPSVTCQNEERDGFTVSTTSGGNGALTYPVGLLTADEIRLAGVGEGTQYLYNGQSYWLLSPYVFANCRTGGFYFSSGGYLSTNGVISGNVSVSYGIRPSISLAKGTRYIDGDGTADNPYVIGDE